MSLQPLSHQRFIRKTQLAPNEYRKNFQQIDREILSVITSPEADQITPLMSKIYLRMVNAPPKYWEREGVLRIEAEPREQKLLKAWTVFCELVGVASATASKAVRWMHEQGIIGYFSGKNGVGLRIFLNRAASSIGLRQAPRGQKILALAPASREAIRASSTEPAFNDSFAVIDILDSDINPRASENGADAKTVDEKVSDTGVSARRQGEETSTPREAGKLEHAASRSRTIALNALVERLKGELEPCVMNAAAQAATRAAAREVAGTRKWFEERALPKAVRVAQRETYDLLRKHGQLDARRERVRAGLEVGRGTNSREPSTVRPLTAEEIIDIAETCVALLEVQGKGIDVTLTEISAEAGGWVQAEDVGRVREAAQSIVGARA